MSNGWDLRGTGIRRSEPVGGAAAKDSEPPPGAVLKMGTGIGAWPLA